MQAFYFYYFLEQLGRANVGHIQAVEGSARGPLFWPILHAPLPLRVSRGACMDRAEMGDGASPGGPGARAKRRLGEGREFACL